MPSRYKNLTATDTKTEKSRLNQLIDIIAADISSSTNRRTYPAFVTGIETPITSSLFNTIFDQNQSYQSANPMLDVTFGLYANIENNAVTTKSSSLVSNLNPTILAGNKLDFDVTTSLMMREKINIYRQYAQHLLGNADASFFAPFDSTNVLDIVKEAYFINVKRLFKRDNIYKGSFGIKLFDALKTYSTSSGLNGNIFTSTTDQTSIMIIDKDGANNFRIGYSGEVGSLYKTTDSGTTFASDPCGLIFYDAGIVVLNVQRIFNINENCTGAISFPDTTQTSVTFPDLTTGPITIAAGKKAIGVRNSTTQNTLKDFLTLASIDDIISNFCITRFPTTSTTAMAFQNETIINSTIFYCNASTDDFNYSTNPTYIDSTGKIQVVDSQEDLPFSYITTVGLYNAAGELLAVAKLSRPIEKNPSHNLSIRVRLDY